MNNEKVLELIREHSRQGADLRLKFLAVAERQLDQIGLSLAKVLARGNKILVCGNGGSAADAQHMSGELVGRFMFERPALACIALSTDTSVLTALGNDYGYEQVFARQIKALGVPGDVLIAISTSGKSRNIVQALSAAREKDMFTVGLTGNGGGAMPGLCDHLLDIPNSPTPLIQELHTACIHLLCRIIDYYLFENAMALLESDNQGQFGS